MSQTIITHAFEQWRAEQDAGSRPIQLDGFILAYLPGLDPGKPIDRNEGIPPDDQIVHRQAVSQVGVVNQNSVVYSLTLGAEVGDFSFNWIGLVNTASNLLAMIVHAPEQQKISTRPGQQRNVLNHSLLMEYDGAAQETQITVSAESWQIDFTARLGAIDERQRRENLDIYGPAAFFAEGYLVTREGSDYLITAGAGYVAGLRTELPESVAIPVDRTAVKVWLDLCWRGSVTSIWQVETTLKVAESLTDYSDNGQQHFVCAVALINEDGSVTDLRPIGSRSEQRAAAFLAKAQNLADLANAETALSNIGGVPGSRRVNGHALSEDIIISAQDIFGGQALPIGDSADLDHYSTPGIYFQPQDD